jgi:hypothetical protein
MIVSLQRCHPERSRRAVVFGGCGAKDLCIFATRCQTITARRAVVTVLIAILLLTILDACSHHVWTTDNVTSYVTQELPDGSDRKQVTSFLDRRNIAHNDTAQDIVATFHNSPSDTSHPDIIATFHFGPDGKLVSRQIRPASSAH